MQSVTSYSENPGAEVSTVKTATVNGWFNAALLRKNLSRFWPLWALYTVIWVFIWPVMQSLSLFGRGRWYESPAEVARAVASMTLEAGVPGGIAMGVIFGVLFAMVLFSYLNTSRSVSMFHGFPIRREGLFLTQYLTGLLVAVTGPGLAIVLAAAVQGVAGVFNGYALGMGFLCAVLPIVFFYSLAVFFAMFTGQILAIPVFYGIFNVFAVAVCSLVQVFAGAFYFGYSGTIPRWVEWLTPVYYMVENVRVSYQEMTSGGFSAAYVEGLPTLLLYAGVGLLLTALALAVYRRRRSESAGDVVAIRWAKPLFRYGVAVCAALSLGQGLYYLVWNAFAYSRRVNFPAMLFCAVLMGWLGYYVAEMLLQKSFRVLRSGLKGALGLTAGLAIFGLAVNFDLLGVENRLPNAAEVATVEFDLNAENYQSGVLKGEENIQRIVELQQAILAEKKFFQDWDINFNGEMEIYSITMGLTYTMQNGSRLERRYYLQYTPEDVEKNPALALLAETATLPALQHASNDIAKLDRFTGGDFVAVAERENPLYGRPNMALTAEQAQMLYDALQRDIDAGHVGVNTLNTGRWCEETYANEINLYYQITEKSEFDDGSRSVSYAFSAHCTELIAALKELGIVTEEVPLVTYAQRGFDQYGNRLEGNYPVDYGYTESSSDYAYTTTVSKELAGPMGVIS